MNLRQHIFDYMGLTPWGETGTPHSHLISSSGPGRSATSDHMQSHIITILIIISTIPKFDKVARDYLLINVTFRAPPDAENQFCISAFGEILNVFRFTRNGQFGSNYPTTKVTAHKILKVSH